MPLGELSFSYARSGGAGGQNVNKVSSKAVLRWPVRASAGLPAPVRARFLERFRHRLTADGDLLLTSSRFRDRGRNVADCIERLAAMLAEVASPPRVRKPTRRTRSAAEARLSEKRLTSRKKQTRRTGSFLEE
ncbi:MAG TPA: alternative ribosome rescue aminoacyl-tRNA hydrolase ArfB [Myxococcota bacterium]|nr:alternative ribosome rescue aminoacyl-tRNA hydrolase ArfB [Myxococcota bacterium]